MENITRKIINKFFKQAKDGVYYVGEGSDAIKYRLNFLREQDSQERKDQIMLNIPDMELFVNKVERYFLIVQGLYRGEISKFDLTYEAYLERLFMSLVANMTYADAQNVYKYIDQRTQLYINTYDEEKSIGKFKYPKGTQEKECDVNLIIDRLSSIMEAPYSFTPEFTDGEHSFMLPSITFGLSTHADVAYVYAVQNRSINQKNPLQKDLDRYFRKVGKDVEGEEELMQVSPNALVSFTMFVSYLKEKGVTQIVAKDFLPARYFSAEATIKERYDDEVAQDKLERLDRDQFNITNKFMYLLMRYNHHFPECQIDYDETLGLMNMKIVNSIEKKDHLLHEVDMLGLQSSKDRIEEENVI